MHSSISLPDNWAEKGWTSLRHPRGLSFLCLLFPPLWDFPPAFIRPNAPHGLIRWWHSATSSRKRSKPYSYKSKKRSEKSERFFYGFTALVALQLSPNSPFLHPFPFLPSHPCRRAFLLRPCLLLREDPRPA